MIIVKLMGGLGNQMFEYAAGRSLAQRHGVELKLDLGFLRADPAGKYTHRHYELDSLKISAAIAGPQDVQRYTRLRESRLSRAVQRLFPGVNDMHYATENGSGYHSSFRKFPAHTYLDGYWQSELYFAEHADRIRSEFVPADPVPASHRSLAEKMGNETSVSVHVRRGDYVQLSSAKNFHGNCDVQYYRRALGEMSRRHGTIQVYVFSDDPQWCRENFSFPELEVAYLEPSGRAAHDLWLMSRCRHHVIANSSFSWWGAWLNSDAAKTVIMPEWWFKNTRSTSIDIVPEGWLPL